VIAPWLAILAVAALLATWMLCALVRRPNLLKWEDLVSSNGFLNAYKIGYWVGVVIGVWVVVKTTYAGQLDGTVFIGFLGYLVGAVGVNSAIGASRKPDDPEK
jgi:hypothetical protein